MEAPKACKLHAALGRAEDCPGRSCGLWGKDGCAVDGVPVHLEGEDLARCLLELRFALERPLGLRTPPIIPPGLH